MDKDTLPGSYFELKKDNIKIFLPSYFDEFSEQTYGELIDALPDSEDKQLEKKRFNFLKFSKGNTYYFTDVALSTLIVVKMMAYMPFTRQDSSYLLGILSAQCEDYALNFGTACRKITAGHSGSVKTSVFKAVYEITKEDTYQTFNTTYLISSNYKTFSINIYSKRDTNYNQYIEKIVVK
ncbi:hypothetical protein MHTCC0001_17740 [Flavobacteriaceae bacterium MHTCC 0001]